MSEADQPTWQTIKTFFTDTDIAHMTPRGFALANFTAVKADAELIFDVVSDGRMPPRKPWPSDRVVTLRRWIDSGCPEGTAEPVWRPTTAPPGGESSRYDDICFVDPEQGWAVNSSGQILHTTDGGDSWEVQFQTPGAVTPAYLRCVRFVDSQVGWAGTTTGEHRMFVTRDGGKTWSVVELPAPAPNKICGLSVVDDKVVYASGTNDPRDDPAVVKTTDGGRTWTAVSMTEHATALIDIHFLDADHGWVVGGRFGAPSPRRQRKHVTPVVLETTDGGRTWVDRVADMTLPLGEWGWKIQFLDDSTGFVSLENLTDGAILKTVDGGRTWQRLPINDPPQGDPPRSNQNLEGIGFINDQLGWVGGWGDANFETGRSSRTTDGGTTWENANEIGLFINRFWFFEGRSDVAYASGRGVFKLSTEPVVEVPAAAIQFSDEVHLGASGSTSPSGETKFDYLVPDGAGEVWLHLWDPFTNLVRTVVHENKPVPGRRTDMWDGLDNDGTPVPGGAYIYRLTIDNAVESGVVYR